MRELEEAPGITGIEGYSDDDWMLVDCGSIVVHLMLPGYLNNQSNTIKYY